MVKQTLISTIVATASLVGVGTAEAQNLTGTVSVDGSSTVYPITEAVAEEFRHEQPNVRVTVGISGSGGGFKRFAKGETDISDASRPIKAKEAAAAEAAGIEFIEIPVAYDGLSIVVNPSNDFIDQLTVDQLRKIFLSKDAARLWSDVNPQWPDRPIKLFSPGTDSGTFDYFKEVVASEDGDSIRSDMSVSEDDNVLVTGVAGDANALGYFGFAYYEENKDKLKVVPIVNPKTNQAVIPASDTIEEGTYAPFSRPLFIYVNAQSAAKPVVREFVEYYLDNADFLAAEVGYVALPEGVYNKAKANFRNLRTGTAYLNNGKPVEGPVTEVYGTE